MISETNQVEIAYHSGAVITTASFGNHSAGHAEALTWIFEHAPGPRAVASIEGTSSYGAGLARAATAAGLPVIEAEQPRRKARRGKGKSDPIDAHLAVLFALGLDADKLPTPRADGDREALRILLCAREELTTTSEITNEAGDEHSWPERVRAARALRRSATVDHSSTLC